MSKIIKHQFFFPHPPQAVWDYLTKPELMEQWLMKNDFQPIVKSGPGEGKITLDSIVVWKLEPKDKGTEVFLEHSGFAKEENLNLYNGLNQGWLANLNKIAKLLNVLQHGHTSA
jgi:uncharacterized protein YndB with AHSA1/START domain